MRSKREAGGADEHRKAAQRQIADVLRNSYEPFIREPLPTEIEKLIGDLEQRTPEPARTEEPAAVVEG